MFSSLPGTKTALTYGPLKKWAPESLLKALRMYSQLPLRPSEYFWTSHTRAQTLILSNVLQRASVTVGHKGVVPSTIFVRKLLTRLVACGESADSVARSTAIDDLAKIDAHSAVVARSVHCDVTDKSDGGDKEVCPCVLECYETTSRMSLRLLLFSLLAPTFTVGQDVFTWIPCLEYTSPPPLSSMFTVVCC